MDIKIGASNLERSEGAQADGEIRGPASSPAPPVLDDRRWLLIAFFAAFALSGIYMYACLNRGWLPQDDGTLAQSALRVLNGQLPHRDFVENYTGGLSFVHAAAFRLFGVNLTSLRLCVFLFFLGSLPAIFYIASRFCSALPSAGITLLSAVWTLPIYSAAMPSWYNLFFALFGAAALFRYLEVGTRRWLVVAGVCGGISFLIKVIGLYYIAAVLLFFVFREQQLNGGSNQPQNRSSRSYRIIINVGLLALPAAIALLIGSRLGSAEFLHFLVPASALVAMLMWRNLRDGGKEAGTRFLALFGMAVPFAAGVLLPIAIFLVPYALTSSLGAFWRGVFVMGASRANLMATKGPKGFFDLLCAVPLVMLLVRAVFWKRAAGMARSLVVAGALAILLLVPGRAAFEAIWNSAMVVTPFVVLLGVGIILLRPTLADNLSELKQQQIVLLLALAALSSLIQYPFAATIYFNYFAPLTALAICALISTRRRIAGPYILASVFAFYAVFAVFRLEPTRVWAMWLSPRTPSEFQPVTRIPRLRGMKIFEPTGYESAVDVIQQHARNGLLVATPECPDLYFSTGLRNPGREDVVVSSDALARVIETEGLNVVVINNLTTFSQLAPTPEAAQTIVARFPHSTTVGRYTIRWRE